VLLVGISDLLRNQIFIRLTIFVGCYQFIFQATSIKDACMFVFEEKQTCRYKVRKLCKLSIYSNIMEALH